MIMWFNTKLTNCITKLIKMRSLLLSIALFIFNIGYSQQTITGTVKDDTGETIPGATILELNTSNGVVTDIEGNFNLSVSGPDAVLQVSFLGFTTQEITVGARSILDLSLIHISEPTRPY